MASALNNIEGEALLSRQDGAGGLDASAALVSVERGNFSNRRDQQRHDLPDDDPGGRLGRRPRAFRDALAF